MSEEKLLGLAKLILSKIGPSIVPDYELWWLYIPVFLITVLGVFWAWPQKTRRLSAWVGVPAVFGIIAALAIPLFLWFLHFVIGLLFGLISNSVLRWIASGIVGIVLPFMLMYMAIKAFMNLPATLGKARSEGGGLWHKIRPNEQNEKVMSLFGGVLIYVLINHNWWEGQDPQWYHWLPTGISTVFFLTIVILHFAGAIATEKIKTRKTSLPKGYYDNPNYANCKVLDDGRIQCLAPIPEIVNDELQLDDDGKPIIKTCYAISPAGDRNCHSCHTPFNNIEWKCDACGRNNPANYAICGHCQTSKRLPARPEGCRSIPPAPHAGNQPQPAHAALPATAPTPALPAVQQPHGLLLPPNTELCPKCGALNPLGFRYCAGACGFQRQQPLALPAYTPPEEKDEVVLSIFDDSF